jgi:putative nucleotidyltransferase with HDIG domain
VFSAKGLTESIRDQISLVGKNGQAYHQKSITVSCGISVAPYGAKSVKELLENVDQAVYQVKRKGKNAIKVFDTFVLNENHHSDEPDYAQVYDEYKSTIYALTAAIDAKDHYTFNHSDNVATYAVALANELKLNEAIVENIRQAALLHDIGKIGIPESILNKPGKLTDDEYRTMQGHVEGSIDIIRHLPSLDYVVPAVLGHHERYDGYGYPRRIAGEDIPLTARILCIADAFDAMVSKRCYKAEMPIDKVLDILVEEAGIQFDPQLVNVFVSLVERGEIMPEGMDRQKIAAI